MAQEYEYLHIGEDGSNKKNAFKLITINPSYIMSLAIRAMLNCFVSTSKLILRGVLQWPCQPRVMNRSPGSVIPSMAVLLGSANTGASCNDDTQETELGCK